MTFGLRRYCPAPRRLTSLSSTPCSSSRPAGGSSSTARMFFRSCVSSAAADVLLIAALRSAWAVCAHRCVAASARARRRGRRSGTPRQATHLSSGQRRVIKQEASSPRRNPMPELLLRALRAEGQQAAAASDHHVQRSTIAHLSSASPPHSVQSTKATSDPSPLAAERGTAIDYASQTPARAGRLAERRHVGNPLKPAGYGTTWHATFVTPSPAAVSRFRRSRSWSSDGFDRRRNP